MPEYWYARFSVSADLVSQAIWVAEKARIALMTKSYPLAESRSLYVCQKRESCRMSYGVPGKLFDPKGASNKIRESHVSVDAAKMMDQAKIGRRHCSKMLSILHSYLWKWKDA